MTKTLGTPLPRDRDWIRFSFVLAGNRLESETIMQRYRNLSTADFKFHGSGFGEDTVINPRPQMTPFADIRRPGLWASSGGNVKTPNNVSSYFTGMGRAYSDMFHENRQVVHIRYGVTAYKGLLTFFTGFYDQSAAILARQGRASIPYYFGLLAGTLATLWLPVVVLAGQGVKYLMGRSSSSYMSLKPTMPLFWLRSNVIMNNAGANLGIISRVIGNTGGAGEEGSPDAKELKENETNAKYKGFMHARMPKIFDKNAQIDLQYGVNQGVRRQLEWSNRIAGIAEKTGSGTNTMQTYLGILDYLNKPITGEENKGYSTATWVKTYHENLFGNLMSRWLEGNSGENDVEKSLESGDLTKLKENVAAASAKTADSSQTQTAVADGTGDTSTQTNQQADVATAGNVQQTPTPTEQSKTAETTATVTGIDATQMTGGNTNKPKEKEMMSTIRRRPGVALTDAEKQAIQDQTAESKNFAVKAWEFVSGWGKDAADIFEDEWNRGSSFVNYAVNYTGAGTISISNSNKDTQISATMNGISSTARDSRISMSDFQTGFGFLDTAVKMVGDVFTGALDSVQMSGLLALSGNAFTVFPKQWDNSNVTVPTATFTIELRAPMGSPIGHYLNIYPTISTLLGGALPISTGPQSYTSPFVLEAYCRGAFAIRYGQISSLTIRHATSNLGYTDDRRPLAFDIDVEIADFSSIYHMAISNGGSPLNILRRSFDDDNAFNDYMSTITGLSINDMVDPRRKLSLNLAKNVANMKTWWSPTHIGSRIADTGPIQALNKIFGPSTFPGM